MMKGSWQNHSDIGDDGDDDGDDEDPAETWKKQNEKWLLFLKVLD